MGGASLQLSSDMAQACLEEKMISGVFFEPAGALSTMSNWLSFLFPKVRTFYLRLCPFCAYPTLRYFLGQALWQKNSLFPP